MISHRVEKRLTHEVHEALALRDKRGRSKHKDKQAARKVAQDNHTAYKTITGLYATTSLTTYVQDKPRQRCAGLPSNTAAATLPHARNTCQPITRI